MQKNYIFMIAVFLISGYGVYGSESPVRKSNFMLTIEECKRLREEHSRLQESCGSSEGDSQSSDNPRLSGWFYINGRRQYMSFVRHDPYGPSVLPASYYKQECFDFGDGNRRVREVNGRPVPQNFYPLAISAALSRYS